MTCYFCEGAVKEKRPFFRGTIVTCPDCGRYSLPNDIIRSLFEREDGRKLLTKKDKKELSVYAKNKFDPNTDELVRIDEAIIKRVTGWHRIWVPK